MQNLSKKRREKEIKTSFLNKKDLEKEMTKEKDERLGLVHLGNFSPKEKTLVK